MGEEYGETAPFLYFIHHGDPALVEAVREGRKKEFAAIGKAELQIDPQDEATFARSRLDWFRRNAGAGAQLRELYTDLLALRREEPALRPGASVANVQGGSDWCTVFRVMPLQGDMFDSVRAHRTIWYAFNLCGHPQEIPVPAEATQRWRLRLSTDAEGYGGSGLLVHSIAAAEPDTDVNDAPKRLLIPATSVEERARTVRLPAWSAAVYVRDMAEGGE
jgi:maltooligosyltrehalose trehalohydrolase